MKFETKSIDVRYSETDQMGFVHHSNHIKYFELARIEWLNSLGVSFAKMEKDGIFIPVVSVNLEYKKPLFFGEQFKVVVSLEKMPKVTMDFTYSIINQKEEVVCVGATRLAFLEGKQNKVIRCPKILIDVFEKWNNNIKVDLG